MKYDSTNRMRFILYVRIYLRSVTLNDKKRKKIVTKNYRNLFAIINDIRIDISDSCFIIINYDKK